MSFLKWRPKSDVPQKPAFVGIHGTIERNAGEILDGYHRQLAAKNGPRVDLERELDCLQLENERLISNLDDAQKRLNHQAQVIEAHEHRLDALANRLSKVGF